MNRFDFYPGDYLRDTIDLTPAEDGVYLRLMCWYYSNERPIPEERAIMIARADREITHGILERFFDQRTDGGCTVWVHPRIEREITKLVNARNRAKENGKKGGRPKGPKTNSEPTSKAKPKAKPNPGQKPPSPSPSPSPSPNPSPSTNNKESACKQAFDIFYQAFPNKKSSQQAWTTWQKLWKKKQLPAVQKIVDAIQYQERMRERYVHVGEWIEPWKHPSSWLNAGAWDDVIATPTKNQKPNPAQTDASLEKWVLDGGGE